MSAMLDPSRWARLRPLLEQALDLEPALRNGFVQSLSGEDPKLADDLLRLLKLNDDEPSALAQPAAAFIGETALLDHPTASPELRRAPWLGKRVGAFELKALLGTGGMGAVYAGERVTGGFRQKVAIKLISGLHPGLMQRFAHERQILADLRHPNIAALLDGGETDDGLPYFAMEYIDGQNLLDHCESTGADLDQRIDLLIAVAEALAHAHGRKLIHRDIKPGNILVSQQGEVKLLDFGIAKLLDATAQPTLTHQTVGPMTPAYAAPEQFRGQPLSAATDIYQFGVLAFRLLSGRSPYRATGDAALELARAVSDEQPLSLSGALKMQSEQDSRISLWLVSGGKRWRDLDLVLARCLAKQPGDRYPDMHALISDLRAVRQARAPRARTQAGQKQRRRWLVTGALLVLVLAAAIAGWSWWRASGDPWRTEPALYALGLDRQHLHMATKDGEAMLRQALRREGAGDMAGARTLLEAAHTADPRSPVPAMLLMFWGNTVDTKARWQAAAEQRLATVKDVPLDLLWKYFLAEAEDRIEDALRYAAALLELKPQAWFLRYARAHLLSVRGLRDAALGELKQIDARRLGHRKLSDSIADRASFGDLAGARAVADSLSVSASDPDFEVLSARLAFTAGDVRAAMEHHRTAVRLAQAQARFDIEGRSLFYAGVFAAVVGELPAASQQVAAARERFVQRQQWALAVDASLTLAQLHALRGEPEQVATAIEAARGWSTQGGNSVDPLIEIVAARLLGIPPRRLPQRFPPVDALGDAWAALLAGDRARAETLLLQAEADGVLLTALSEEARLLRQALGLPIDTLPPLDPPFPPHLRFVARVVLGQPDSVAPRSPAAR